MITMEFTKNLPDIPRVLTAATEWSACMLCIMTIKRKTEGWKLGAIGFIMLAVQCLFLTVTDRAEGIMWNICMLAAFLLMFVFICLCNAIHWSTAVVVSCVTFMVSEFTASLIWQLYCYLHSENALESEIQKKLILLGVYGLICFIIWKIEKNMNYKIEEYTFSKQEIWTIVLITIGFFGFSNLGFLPVRFPFTGRDSLEIFNMRTVTDLGGAALLFAYVMQGKSANMKKELDRIQNILNNQYEQYKQAERAIELVNYRHHDLKNYILVLKGEKKQEDQLEYLDKLEKEIQQYEVLSKTGNHILDTLLTNKNLECMKHKITLTAVVDGSLFSFMDVMDICSIFGNALDNAIESVRKIKDYEKRIIHVDASSEKNFLLIRFENYYEGEIKFHNELPVTTKVQKHIHGYGLKSLIYTVHKYRGEVNIDTKDQWFRLRILIPL